MHRNTRHCEVRGVWSEIEHERFIEAMTMYPLGPWKRITDHVGTRSIKQVQTHAQKYQQKLRRQQRGLRKRKTKLKQPEHRVDKTTMGLFTHKSILRYTQRLVKEHEERVDLPGSPVDPSFVGFNLDRVRFDDWAEMTIDMPDDIGLEDLLPDPTSSTTEEDEDDIEIPRFDAMYDAPCGWNEWQLDELLQPTPVDTTLSVGKGGHPDGSELPIFECTV